MVFLGIVAVAAGVTMTLFAAKAIAHPIGSVRRGLERIERGELDAAVPVDDASEVGLLQAGFNRMADGLRERKRIRDLFGRHVGEEVALNRFFRVVIEVIEAQGGLVNKFQGDAALCVFGAPVASADPAGDALRAARALAVGLSRELPEIDFGIGISAGVALAGNVGAENRLEYTVIGDPVNEAARLSGWPSSAPNGVLASPGVAHARPRR